jgi:hypothetical protein
MSREIKYVISNNSCPILFPSALNHSDFQHFHPTSAGMCCINKDGDKFKVDCFGESVSLKLKPAGNDHIHIEIMLNHFNRR